ncbi:hypothetical protein FRB96_009047 [Tulasnella sp. 330]|nr:hypothetical protein FRB96_009047 [Tulasnella sp. 330]KAG8871550.1 hypothetical protein FRB97_008581 [Tulasnella sp. 331]KAG8874449.1 hypothetical protein FRB98_008431 [Tulasnella sp. 332]
MIAYTIGYSASFLLGALSLAKGSPVTQRNNIVPPLTWGPCPTYNDTLPSAIPFPVVCADFSVPVDWRSPHGQKVDLKVGKIAATTNTSLGSLYMNPGGPGQSGIDFLQSSQILAIYNSTGGAFDLVSWDPRGVDFSSSPIECFDDTGASPGPFTFDAWVANLTTLGGLQAPSSGPSAKDINTLNANLKPWSSVVETFTRKCNQKNAARLTQVGTVAFAHDLVAIADAISGPQTPINYYGYSYGTVPGAYFINLFPERVGRVVLDGVVNATLSSSAPGYEFFASSISDGDATLQQFLAQCAESGPSGCALASTNSTQSSLKAWINQLIDDAYNFAPLGSGMTSFDIRVLLESTARAPSQWQDMAMTILEARQAISALMHGSNTNNTSGGSSTSMKIKRAHEFSAALPAVPRSSNLMKRTQTAAQSIDNNWSVATAVFCGDNSAPPHTAADTFDSIVNTSQTVSSIFAPFLAAQPEVLCSSWPYRAVQRYSGPWDAKTIANPIVVIGNTFDPVTPLHMAKELVRTVNSNGKRSAALIQQDGSGHTTLEEPSLCTQALLRAYFTNGSARYPLQPLLIKFELIWYGELPASGGHAVRY